MRCLTKGTGSKACSPHIKFKSRKSSDALLLGRESRFICGHRILIYILYFQILITLSTFISSRLLTSFASLSIQIKPVKYLADKKKLGNNVSYFTFFFNFSKLTRKLSFTNEDLVFHTNYYFGIYFSKGINSSLYSYKCVTWSK